MDALDNDLAAKFLAQAKERIQQKQGDSTISPRPDHKHHHDLAAKVHLNPYDLIASLSRYAAKYNTTCLEMKELVACVQLIYIGQDNAACHRDWLTK